MILRIDFSSEIPIYLQIRNQIVMGIGFGQIKFDEHLPTVRQLANDLGINSMTVNKAYNLLKNEGFIYIDRRHGAVVKTIEDIPDNRQRYKEKLYDDLELVISEAALRGIEKNEFMDLCIKIFLKKNNLNEQLLDEDGVL